MPYISKKQLAELRKIAGTAIMSHASFGFNEQEGFVAALESVVRREVGRRKHGKGI